MTAELAERVADLVGEDVLRVTDASSRWPALAELVADGIAVPVALYIARVGLSHRGRDHVERRFQNPGSDRPILHVPGRQLLLLGLWDADPLMEVRQPLLVSAEARRRLGFTTRYSVFVTVGMLSSALDKGWAAGETATGESIRCFLPPLLPLSFSADADRTPPETFAMQAAIEASGLLVADEAETSDAAERARRVGSRLVRDSRFSARVLDAYDGQCAMCGLNVGLVQGAHIYPVAAQGSYDEPWNGLALCANHHLGFDKHLLAVRPEASEIVFHPAILEEAEGSRVVQRLVEATFEQLARPRQESAIPKPEMFDQRYALFADQYEWLAASP